MPRTEEQVKADNDLTEAIQNVLDAYQEEEHDGYMMSDFLVICAQSRLDSDGEAETAYNYLYRDGSMAAHTILGLLDIARGRIQANVSRE